MPRRLAIAWSLLFALAHFYWALGGHLLMPSGYDMSEHPIFLAYDLVAGVLCVLGAWLLASGRAPRLVLLGFAALAVRGVVGVAGDVVIGLEPSALFDVWFVLGAALYGAAIGVRLPRALRLA